MCVCVWSCSFYQLVYTYYWVACVDQHHEQCVYKYIGHDADDNVDRVSSQCTTEHRSLCLDGCGLDSSVGPDEGNRIYEIQVTSWNPAGGVQKKWIWKIPRSGWMDGSMASRRCARFCATGSIGFDSRPKVQSSIMRRVYVCI